MEPISNTDRLILLLRQKLEERAKASANSRSTGRANPAASAPVEPSGVRAMMAVEGADEHSLRRAVLQNLLADHLGPELINDAQFQQVVTRVSEAIEEDDEASTLLTQVIAQLRAA